MTVAALPMSVVPATRWADDPGPMLAASAAAAERLARGEPAVPFFAEVVTSNRAEPNGGRMFGVELEFDVVPGQGRRRALDNIAHELHGQGLVRRPVQGAYHANRRDRGMWRFERDATVHGEVISPLSRDGRRFWEELAVVCSIIRRHGGRGTKRTATHVHVSVADYDSGGEVHSRLLQLFKEHEDTFYRLAQNPEQPSHRGTRWCSPNRPPGPSSRTPVGLGLYHCGHHLALNFAGVRRVGDDNHIELRLWDSSLDPGVIQVQVRLSVGLADAARRPGEGEDDKSGARPLGAHWQARESPDGHTLDDTGDFRRLVDRAMRREEDKVQAAALFAVTSWQRPPSS